MSFDFGENRRSPPLARLLSYLLPGLGHYYSDNVGTGILWMLGAFLYWYIIYWIMSEAGDFDFVLFLELGVGYFMFCSIAGHIASKLTVDYNARQGLQEMIKKEKEKK